MKLKKSIRKKKKPKFHRQEYTKKKLKNVWRKPRGKRSKLRMKEKARGKTPSSGYRNPKVIRGLSPLGFKEVRVFNEKDVQNIKKDEMAVIGSAVGNRKRIQIQEAAKHKGVRISI